MRLLKKVRSWLRRAPPPQVRPVTVTQTTKAAIVLCTPIPRITIERDGRTFERLAPITVEWQRARHGIALPLGHNMAEVYADGKTVDEARGLAVTTARANGARFIFFLDYDVIVPWNVLVKLVYQADQHPERYIFAGVYGVKRHPSEPLLWREWDNGITWDWTLGDVLEDIVAVGMGCTLIRLSLFDQVKHTPENPWFLTRNGYDPKEGLEIHQTEDTWLCRRMIEETGQKCVVDTSIVSGHINNDTGEVFVIPDDSLPVKRAKEAGRL